MSQMGWLAAERGEMERDMLRDEAYAAAERERERDRQMELDKIAEQWAIDSGWKPIGETK